MKQKAVQVHTVVFILHTTSWYFQIYDSNSLEESWRVEGLAGVYLQLELLPLEIPFQFQAHYWPRIALLQVSLVQKLSPT